MGRVLMCLERRRRDPSRMAAVPFARWSAALRLSLWPSISRSSSSRASSHFPQLALPSRSSPLLSPLKEGSFVGRSFAGNRLLCYPCFRSTAQLRRPALFRKFRASLALVSKVNLSLLESNLFPVHHNTHLCANNHFVTIHMPFSEVQGRISLKIVARGIQHKESPKTKNRRLRRKFSGTPKKPRLSVFCSTRQLYALLVDDQNQKTLFYASTLQNSIRDDPPCSTLEAAHRVGEAIVKACKELNISEISSYDRNGFHRGRRMRAFEVAIAEHGLLPH